MSLKPAGNTQRIPGYPGLHIKRPCLKSKENFKTVKIKLLFNENTEIFGSLNNKVMPHKKISS